MLRLSGSDRGTADALSATDMLPAEQERVHGKRARADHRQRAAECC